MCVFDLDPYCIILNNNNNNRKKILIVCLSIKTTDKIYDNGITYLSDIRQCQTCDGDNNDRRDNDHDNDEDNSLIEKSTYRLGIIHG